MRMCPENKHISNICFQHRYRTYYSNYLLENLHVYSLDMFLKGRVSQDIGPSVSSVVCRRWKSGRKLKKITNVTCFLL